VEIVEKMVEKREQGIRIRDQGAGIRNQRAEIGDKGLGVRGQFFERRGEVRAGQVEGTGSVALTAVLLQV